MATFRLASFANADKIDRCLGICQSLTQTLHYVIPGFLISSHCYGFGLWNLVSGHIWPQFPYMRAKGAKYIAAYFYKIQNGWKNCRWVHVLSS